MPYVTHESTRLPARQSYSGPLCLSADVTGGLVYTTKATAIRDARKLTEHGELSFTVSKQPDSEPLPFDLTQR